MKDAWKVNQICDCVACGVSWNAQTPRLHWVYRPHRCPKPGCEVSSSFSDMVGHWFCLVTKLSSTITLRALTKSLRLFGLFVRLNYRSQVSCWTRRAVDGKDKNWTKFSTIFPAEIWKLLIEVIISVCYRSCDFSVSNSTSVHLARPFTSSDGGFVLHALWEVFWRKLQCVKTISCGKICRIFGIPQFRCTLSMHEDLVWFSMWMWRSCVVFVPRQVSH